MPAEDPWPLRSTLVLFAAAWFVLGWPWLSGAVTIPWDAKAHFYPQLQFLAQSLHRGEEPFWAPFVFSGTPQIADPQSLVASPPFLILALLHPDPSFRAADAVVLAMLALGGASLILLFRDRGWHPAGALVAAIAFAFGASAAWRIQHVGQIVSLSLWPLALWLLLRALERSSGRAGAATGLAAGVMALGRDQVAYLGLWLLVGAVAAHWTAAPSLGTLRRSLKPLLAGAAAGALLLAGPLLLTLLLAGDSNRPAISYGDAARGSLHPALLLTAVVPNLFGADGPFLDYWGPPSPRWGLTDLVLARNMGVLYLGALPLAVTAYAAASGALWDRGIRFVTIACLAMLLYALGRHTPVFRAAFEILPGVGLFRRPADATFLAGALGAILAGYSVHRFWTGSPACNRLVLGWAGLFLLVGILAAAAGLASAKAVLPLAAWPLATAGLWWGLALAALAGLRPLAARSPPLAVVLVIGLLVADLAANNGPNESTALPPETYEVLRPDSRNPTLASLKAALRDPLERVELTGLGFHWPNASLVHGLHNVLGYNPVRLRLYSEATGAGDHVALPEQRSFSPLFPSYRSRLADLLGLRLIATGVPVERIDPHLRPGDLRLLGRTPDGFVYENPRALPRVLFASQAEGADFQAILASGDWPDFDPTRTVLLEHAQPEPRRGEPGTPRLSVVSYRNTEVVIEVEAGTSGHVVLNDPYHPWWFAEVEGKDTPVLRANVLFRAVPVPAGRHRVRLTFRPWRGAWQALVTRWSGPERSEASGTAASARAPGRS